MKSNLFSFGENNFIIFISDVITLKEAPPCFCSIPDISDIIVHFHKRCVIKLHLKKTGFI